MAAPALVPGSRDLARAFLDLRNGFLDWRLWGLLGWLDIKQRYRRSTLGPLWLILSSAIHVTAIGVIWGTLFNLPLAEFMPYICLGLLIWNFMLGIINEGCTAFTGQAAGYITQMTRPLSTYFYWVLWRNLIIFLHSFAIYVVVAIVFQIPITRFTPLALVGLPLMLAFSAWPVLLFGLISARYRDIPQIVGSLLTVAFFVTPILWKKDMLADRAYLAQFNPLSHAIDVVRDPLLGVAPAPESWIITASITLVGWVGTMVLFSRYRARIPYWL